MRRVTLPPIVYRPEYAEKVEREILAYLEEVIFVPLRGLFPEEMKENEDGAIRAALLAGTLIFVEGEFRGAFDAAVSRELRGLGAQRTSTGFKFAPGAMPVLLRVLTSEIALRNASLHDKFEEILAAMAAVVLTATTGIHVAKTIDNITRDLQTQLIKSVSGVEGLEVPAKIPEGIVSELRDQAALGIDYAIRKFSLEQINELRALVRRNAEEGGRADRLRDRIEVQFGVTQRKARTIAENETSLVASAFRRTRYRSIGLNRYRWETSHDEKVRPTHGESNNHRILDGREFDWDSPPVVDAATGRRRHPGEDYGPCRCVARPVLILP